MRLNKKTPSVGIARLPHQRIGSTDKCRKIELRMPQTPSRPIFRTARLHSTNHQNQTP